ncbi:MAG: DUF1343 domain-containing protein [Myxococcales bacterium]|nr:DUF1343 domain-containing protein [Myxococcales bacterium]
MQIGLERLANDDAGCGALRKELGSRRVGLLAHPAAVDRDMRHVSAVFADLGIRPRLIFGPEHGYGGEAQDMIGVANAADRLTGAPIISLYGDSFDDLSPKPEHLAEIDVLVVDLADVGSRYYTFIWTALLAARAAAAAGVQTVILDRPNPLGGVVAEGKHQEGGFLSFVGLEPVPVRHALTIGEVVALFAHRGGLALGASGALRVVPNAGWERGALAPRWDRPFVMTSPNMPTFETALVYPGGCLIEGTNLSEGRGTTRPFEIVGAPFLDGARLAADLTRTKLPGFCARPVTFLPTFQKHAGKICGGVQIHPTDPSTFQPYATYLALVALARAQAPEDFRFRTERYEYVDDIPAFDLLTGGPMARELIEAGDPVSDWVDGVARVEPGWNETVREAEALVRRAS